MALNPDAVGTKTEPVEHPYDWQDAALYALGIGAKADQLDFLYEKRGPKVFPTFAVVPAFEVNRKLFDVVGGDLSGVVHGSQKITSHAPFPSKATLTTVGEVAGIYDLKRMAQSVIRTETRDDEGPTSPEQAILYRLGGHDYNPLHIDPEAAMKAEKVTQGRPILHGLCTYGYIGRAIVEQECGGDPAKLKTFYGRFSKPIWPGETIVTEGWREDGRLVVRAATKERPNEHIFTNAYAEFSG